jgi:ribosome biogenesis GTPase
MNPEHDSYFASLGWNATLDEAFHEATADGSALFPGRITSTARNAYFAATGSGELLCSLSGKMRESSGTVPVTGDWVLLRLHEGRDAGVVEALLPRRTLLRRAAAGRKTEEQPLAANVDYVFIVSGADGELNSRRIERYMTIVWESGAVPIALLNKIDIADDPAAQLSEMARAAPGAEIVPVSALSGEGIEELSRRLGPGATGVLLGSSGTGKSTIINRILGREERQTRETRESDGKGRHVSVDRRLFVLPQGGCIIDTPGLREVGLWSSEGLEGSFADIEELAEECRFGDCSHDHEPGCAVRAAIESGELDPARLDSYRRQLRELAFIEDRKSAKQRKEEWEKEIAQKIRRWRQER